MLDGSDPEVFPEVCLKSAFGECAAGEAEATGLGGVDSGWGMRYSGDPVCGKGA